MEILPVKILGDDGQGSNFYVAWGMLYAAGLVEHEIGDGIIPYNPKPVQVMNLSLGSDKNDLTEAVVEEVLKAGVIVVAGTGNDSSSVSYPAGYEGVIGVGAVEPDQDGLPVRAFYSNFEYGLNVVAPGGNAWDHQIWSTLPGNKYRPLSGTLMATPHVSGVIGLMLANGMPNYEVQDVLERTSMPLTGSDYDAESGYGIVNAYWAVNGVSEMKVIVGERQDDRVQTLFESQIAPKGGAFNIHVAPGEYQLIAWVDVNNNNIIDEGDYYGESEFFEIPPGSTLSLSGTIEEIGPGEIEQKIKGKIVPLVH